MCVCVCVVCVVFVVWCVSVCVVCAVYLTIHATPPPSAQLSATQLQRTRLQLVSVVRLEHFKGSDHNLASVESRMRRPDESKQDWRKHRARSGGPRIRAVRKWCAADELSWESLSDPEANTSARQRCDGVDEAEAWNELETAGRFNTMLTHF